MIAPRPYWICLTLLVLQCTSTREAEQTPPPPPQPQEASPLQFETKQDTVFLQNERENGLRISSERGPEIRFMVQIGAFKDAQNASGVQTLTRERYHVPVLNDFHTGLSLYQIRVGFFETYEAAQAFRLRLQREYPGDYNDSWIVKLKR